MSRHLRITLIYQNLFKLHLLSLLHVNDYNLGLCKKKNVAFMPSGNRNLEHQNKVAQVAQLDHCIHDYNFQIYCQLSISNQISLLIQVFKKFLIN